MGESSSSAGAAVSAKVRLAALAATWALLVLAAPGVLAPGGAWPLAALAPIPWAAVSSRPGRRAFLVEWLVAGLGSAALCAWSVYVWWVTLVFIAVVPGLYHALSGVVLRRLATRLPLAIAAPAAWVPLELARTVVEPPFGYGWMRLGTFAHDLPGVAGSARTWGVYGLSFVLAAFAGGVADLLRARRAPEVSTGRGLAGLALGLVPLAVALVLARVVPAPATVDGPRVLLVQPNVSQSRKMEALDAGQLFAEARALTMKGLTELRARGEPEPDLVAWGETMLTLPAMEEGLEEALARGVRSPEWTRAQIGAADVAWARGREAAWVGGALFGAQDFEPVIPAGASFLAGCELFLVRDEAIRRANAVVLWDAAGRRAGDGAKVHLVPGAEHLAGLERLAWVRSAAQAVAGYTPDLVAFERTAVLELAARDGRARWPFGVTVCFDNAYDDPYTGPARRGPLDFHVVCSNEAWYLESFELDQMVAFSRLIAIQTGRSLVRATNAGVTTVLGPDGREVARLVADGRDRQVAGTLAVTVPVPREGATVPYPRWERAWQLAWTLGPALLLAGCVLAGRRRRAPAPA